MCNFEPRRLEAVSRITRAPGGVLLEFENLFCQSPVFLSTVKFDLLYNFLDLRLHLLKGDFGRYKRFDKIKIGTVCRLTFAPEESFEINPENYRGNDEFEVNVIKVMTNFFRVIGLYQPKHILSECVCLSQHNDLFALVMVPSQQYPQIPTGCINDWNIGENKLARGGFREAPNEYAIIFNQNEPVALGGGFVRQNQEEVCQTTPIRMLPTTEVEIVRIVEAVNGITDTTTLPEQGYRLRVENGLGDTVLGVLSKQQLKSVADKLAK